MANDLFTTSVLQNIGNRDVPLTYMTDRLKKGMLLKPEFQRDYVWEENGIEKAKGWFDTVMTNQAIGVIVTYQLIGYDSPLFIADGLQRLTATNRIIDCPGRSTPTARSRAPSRSRPSWAR